jgi:hypothetical protein
VTVKELRAEAARRGVAIPARARKAEIEALLNAVPRTVVDAVEHDLAVLAEREPSLPKTALAASALELARQLDDPDNSATSKSMCSRALTEAMDRLEDMAPPKREGDRLDKLRDRRAS